MDGFCLLYLLLILLMRSGDVETNPGPNTAESTVSEMEFLKLAQAIAPSYYNAVGISLGIPHAQLQAILVRNLKNYTDALMDVFMKWNVMQQPSHSNKRQLLAEKLGEIDLGGLSDRLLNEPPISNSTGGPSRLSESQTKPPSADSQTKPLSPELVERCANDFKFKYRSTVCKIRADPLKPSSLVGFEKRHANLVLEEEDGTDKQTIDYNDILDLRVNGEFPKRIMVQGEAGVGKTFFAEIASDWVKGRHFNHFVWVLIVPLHESKQHSIGEIAKSYLDKNNPATVSQINEYIRSNPDKVFIAFDGLDEVSGKIMKTESCESQPTDQMQLQPSDLEPSVTSSEACGSSSETGDIGLVDILCSDQLASCPVLLTTRPWKIVTLRATQHAIDTSSYGSKPTSLYSSSLYGSPSTTYIRDAYRPHRPEISRRTTNPITATYEPKTYSDAYSTKYASRSIRPEQRSPSVSTISRDLLRLPLMDVSPSRTYKSSHFGSVPDNLYKSSIEDLQARRPRDSSESRTSSADSYSQTEKTDRPSLPNRGSSYSTLKRTPSIVKLTSRRSSFGNYSPRTTAGGVS